MMNDDHRNLIAAIVLSVLIIVLYQMFFLPPPQDAGPGQTGQPAGQQETDGEFPGQRVEDLPQGGQLAELLESDSAAVTAPRVDIANAGLGGSLSLAGGRFDHLELLGYARDDASDPERVELLRGTADPDSYFAEVLFLDPSGGRLVPKDTVWQASGGSLAPDSPLSLSHREGGVAYRLDYAIDENYLITIRASATNNSGNPVAVRQFARIRRNLPSTTDFFISYEGPLGVFAEGQKTETDYSDIEDIGFEGKTRQAEGVKGWIGITDKYWLVALIPDADNQQDYHYGFRRAAGPGEPSQVDVNAAATVLANGQTVERVFHLFAGPKKIDVLESYNARLGVERLDHAIDWGWFPFLTKPFFYALNWLYGHLGNFGLAIMALTVVIKLAFFPLANKSYHSMAKMRELSPKIQELRERFGNDRQRQQQEMMALYRQQKVNPAAGCLPLLLQIPVFFALYKVLFVTIEMRHAPFYGWITDLSALDPTSIINLFGLLPFSTSALPDIVNLGVLPILMGLTMHVQMSLNPPPPDPVQAKIFKLMPVFFTFLLATFPAGLVIYWTWNNLLSIIQQMFIMRSVKRASA